MVDGMATGPTGFRGPANGAAIPPRDCGDIVDAHVVLCARRSGQQIVTSDRDDLQRLDPAVKLVVV
jgi:predicted nucleic acid-binding protein